MVKLTDENQIPLTGKFIGLEERDFPIEFYWVPMTEIGDIEIYPTNAAELLARLDGGVEHYVYREE